MKDRWCQLGGTCYRTAKFAIRRIKTDEWLDVCGTHDNYVGIENLISLGHTAKDARKINKEVKNGTN